MMVGIIPGIPSTNTSNSMQKSLERISSGNRINSASDDAAGAAIAQRLQSQLTGISTSIRNANDGISFAQFGSGALESIQASLGRVRELALQSANGTLNASDRQALNAEARSLMDSIENTVNRSNFNGVSVFSSNQSVSFSIGTSGEDSVSLDQTGSLANRLTDQKLFELDIGSVTGATSALSQIDDATATISQSLSELSATAKRLESSIDQLTLQNVSTASAKSRIADSDLAAEASNLIASQIREEASIAIKAQANARSGLVLRLLG